MPTSVSVSGIGGEGRTEREVDPELIPMIQAEERLHLGNDLVQPHSAGVSSAQVTGLTALRRGAAATAPGLHLCPCLPLPPRASWQSDHTYPAASARPPTRQG